MKNPFKAFNNFTRKIDRLLGVEHTRKDYQREHKPKPIKMITTNLSSDEQKILKDIFKSYDYEQGFRALFAEDESYIELISKLVEDTQLSNSLKLMFEEKILNTDYYKEFDYVEYDSINFSDSDDEILEKIRIQIKKKFIIND